MEKGLQAVVRRFPSRCQEIMRLALADASFRSLCDDLSDAETALSQWARSTSPQSDLRRSEYEVLVAELAAEIEGILDARSGERSS